MPGCKLALHLRFIFFQLFSLFWSTLTNNTTNPVFISMQALHQPVTSVLALVFILIFGLIHHRHIGYAEVGMSYDRIIGDHEWWRCGSSQLSHVELYHLIFNLTALWSIGIAERVMGLGYYLKITALLFILSPLVRFFLCCLNAFIKKEMTLSFLCYKHEKRKKTACTTSV